MSTKEFALADLKRANLALNDVDGESHVKEGSVSVLASLARLHLVTATASMLTMEYFIPEISTSIAAHSLLYNNLQYLCRTQPDPFTYKFPPVLHLYIKLFP